MWVFFYGLYADGHKQKKTRYNCGDNHLIDTFLFAVHTYRPIGNSIHLSIHVLIFWTNWKSKQKSILSMILYTFRKSFLNQHKLIHFFNKYRNKRKKTSRKYCMFGWKKIFRLSIPQFSRIDKWSVIFNNYILLWIRFIFVFVMFPSLR